MLQILLLNSQSSNLNQVNYFKQQLISQTAHIQFKIIQNVQELSRQISQYSESLKIFILFNDSSNPDAARRYLTQLEEKGIRFYVCNTPFTNSVNQVVSENIEQLAKQVLAQIVYFRSQNKRNVNIAVLKSMNTKFRHQIKQLNNYLLNSRVNLFEFEYFNECNKLIANSEQVIMIIHSEDILYVHNEYSKFIQNIHYSKLVVILYGDLHKSLNFKFDISVNNSFKLKQKLDWLIRQSISKIKIKDRSYQIVVLNGDTVFESFYKMFKYKYSIVNSLTNQHKNSLIIAPSSKQKELQKHLHLHLSSIGIISTIQSNPVEITSYHHPNIKLITNSINKCISRIDQLNNQANEKQYPIRNKIKSQYNPARANMWQRLDNQLKNHIDKCNRISESNQKRELSAKSYKLYSVRSKEKREKLAEKQATPNQQYGTPMLPGSLVKKNSELSTQTNSWFPSAIAAVNVKSNKQTMNNQQIPVEIKRSTKQQTTQEQDKSLSFGQLSSIPSSNHMHAQFEQIKQSDISKYQSYFNNQAANKVETNQNSNKKLSNIQNIMHSQYHLSTEPSKNKNYNTKQTQRQNIKLHSSQPIQLLFKTNNLCINKLYQYYNNTPFTYKYQSFSQLKQCLRSCHQDMLSLIICDCTQIIQTMKLLAVFDHLHYIIIEDDNTIQQLNFLKNQNLGFINEKSSLSKIYKGVSAHIRELKIDHYKISEGDLRNYSDGVLNQENITGQMSLFYFQNDRHIETFVNRINLSNYFLLKSFGSLEDLSEKINLQKSLSQNSMMIVILNGHLASIVNTLIPTQNSKIKFIIYESNKNLYPSKPLNIPLVTTDNQLLTQIQKMIQ